MAPTPPRARAKATPKSATASPPTRDWGGELAQVRGCFLAVDQRISDSEKQLVETHKLTKNLDTFAAQLVQHQESVDERFREAVQSHEAKL